MVTNFNGNKKLKYISFLDNPMTSSFMVKLNNSHSLGFFTILNSVVASHIITCVFNYSTFFDTPFYEYINVDTFKLSKLSFKTLI